MSDICYPPGADWGCAYTPEQLETMRADPVTAARMDLAEALAWMQLAALTADQLGTCPITVRPCSAGCTGGGTYLAAPVGGAGHYAGALPGRTAFTPHVGAGGLWVNACGCSAGDCSCTVLCEAILPGPVGAVTEVWLDGALLDPTAYRVDNGNRLVRTDGGCWPACQDMAGPSGPQYEPVVHDYPVATVTWTREGDEITGTVQPKGIPGDVPLTAMPWPGTPSMVAVVSLFQGVISVQGSSYTLNTGPASTPGVVKFVTPAPPGPVDYTDTFSVTYYQGAAPNSLALYVAGLLATEYYKACVADKSCRLPARLQSVARQGVTYQVAFDDTTGTGIREIDDFVSRLNPYRLKMPPTISSPQTSRARQTTWSR